MFELFTLFKETLECDADSNISRCIDLCKLKLPDHVCVYVSTYLQNTNILTHMWYACIYVGVRVCVQRACMHTCVRASQCARVRAKRVYMIVQARGSLGPINQNHMLRKIKVHKNGVGMNHWTQKLLRDAAHKNANIDNVCRMQTEALDHIKELRQVMHILGECASTLAPTLHSSSSIDLLHLESCHQATLRQLTRTASEKLSVENELQDSKGVCNVLRNQIVALKTQVVQCRGECRSHDEIHNESQRQFTASQQENTMLQQDNAELTLHFAIKLAAESEMIQQHNELKALNDGFEKRLRVADDEKRSEQDSPIMMLRETRNPGDALSWNLQANVKSLQLRLGVVQSQLDTTETKKTSPCASLMLCACTQSLCARNSYTLPLNFWS